MYFASVLPVLLLAVLAASGRSSSTSTSSTNHPHNRPDEAFQCDVNKETRATIAFKALERLKMNDFSLVKTGIFAGHGPTSGEQVAGNPNTLYMIAGFNDTEHLLTPADYPSSSWPVPPDDNGPVPPSGPLSEEMMGVSMDRNEAIVLFFCTPPPMEYFGLTAYVTNRVLFNETERGKGDSSLIVHMPMAEIANPLNYLRLNTTKASAFPSREDDPTPFYSSLSLAVFSPSRAVFETVAEAFIQAGLEEGAVNYYPMSGQTLRLHDRSKPFEYDYPDRFLVLCRVSYFQDQAAGEAWSARPWPAFFVRAPDLPVYQKSVPEPRILSDVSGDSEKVYLPTIEKLMSAIVANKTSTGQARLLVQQQIVSVPNDRGARDQCLNNNSFVAAVDPIMTGRGGCGYGTTDCR
ncbi:hypothetical protein VYU27_002257, partial [Nannochloropsis oceanica]